MVRASDERDQLTAAATHDMLNALAGLSGYLELLEDEPASEQSRKLQRRVRRVTTRLMLLSEDLLVHATAGAGVPIATESVSVAEEVNACVAEITGLEAVLDVDVDLALLTDRLRLHQILGNLVRNAHRYGRPPVLIGAHQVGSELVRITVSDAGEGVPADFVSVLFDPHTRALGTGLTGTGLGLSVSRELAERQGGTLTYEPADHRFVLVLPTTPPCTPPVRVPGQTSALETP